MKKFLLFILSYLLITGLFSQEKDTTFLLTDSSEGIVVQAFYSNTKWKDVPHAVTLLSEKKLQQFSPHSMVAVLNTVAGVRLEERSPASYRISIRGSLLRSPFGVRNIKVYWNDLPLSDGGGNTYLNLVELQNINTIEVLKGPSASVYGAGTAGVLLLKTNLPFSNSTKNTFNISVNTGSYNLFNEHVQWQHQQKKYSMQLQQSHTQAKGYREQSAVQKNVLQYNGNLLLGNHQLSIFSFYSNLYYQTPGGITEKQMIANPKLARQATATLPSAIQQQTAIYNTTFFTGINDNYTINQHLSTETSITSSITNFKNPFITNYEIRKEVNTGLRTKLIHQQKFSKVQLKNIVGFEWLHNSSKIDNYGNRNGVADTLQFKDVVKANQWFAFVQTQISFAKFIVSAGISFNEQLYKYKRVSSISFDNYLTASSKIIATPRVSLLYKINNQLSLYSIAAKGFSAPSLAEIRPSDGNFYSNLQAEYGWNFETGIKGNILKNTIQFDFAYYHFKLQNAIVRRNNNVGSEYFINAGSTLQQGFEATINAKIFERTKSFFTSLNVSNSYSYQPYIFKEYRIGNNNFSGNNLTGVPKQINVITCEVILKQNFYTNIIFNYTSAIALTDANDAFASDYRLLQIKSGYNFLINTTKLNVYFGVDNVLNELYSLGNDINAFGKRYFNPAPARNFFVGVKVGL